MGKRWTLDRCKASAEQYPNAREWRKGDRNAYLAAQRQGWFEDCTKDMPECDSKWTLEECKKSALQYSTKNKWARACGHAYKIAKEHLGWMDICSEHMTSYAPDVKWTLEACKADAAQYLTLNEWRKASPSACEIARQKGWRDECCTHMPQPKKNTKKQERT